MTVNWNTHHGVLKDSATSPIRLEGYSSFPNGSTVVTGLLVKGLSTINSSFSNIVRFSNYEVALAGNISTACNGIKLKEVKHHVRENWLKFYQNQSQKAVANQYK